MAAGTYNIAVEQGATYTLSLTLTDGTDPIDLTGASAELHVKEDKTKLRKVLDLSSSAGSLILGDAAGTITFTLSPETTAALVGGTYVYDLLVALNSSTTYRVIEGSFTVSEAVTL